MKRFSILAGVIVLVGCATAPQKQSLVPDKPSLASLVKTDPPDMHCNPPEMPTLSYGSCGTGGPCIATWRCERPK